MGKVELVLTKPGKTFKDYRHLSITETEKVCIINFIKGRLYQGKKTMNPTYEPFPTKQEAVERFEALADELRGKGYVEEPVDILFRVKEKEVYVYDKAKWHYDGDFPAGLDRMQAYVPSGMFIAWAIKNDLVSSKIRKRDKVDIELVKRDEMTGAQFFRSNWDGVLTSRELSDEGDAFAREYMNIQNDIYTATDFADVLAKGLPTIYHVEDTIENYRLIEPIIAERYREWKARK